MLEYVSDLWFLEQRVTNSHGMLWNSANPLNLVLPSELTSFAKTGEVTVDTMEESILNVYLYFAGYVPTASAKCVYEEWMMKEIGVATNLV